MAFIFCFLGPKGLADFALVTFFTSPGRALTATVDLQQILNSMIDIIAIEMDFFIVPNYDFNYLIFNFFNSFLNSLPTFLDSLPKYLELFSISLPNFLTQFYVYSSIRNFKKIIYRIHKPCRKLQTY